MKQPHPSTKRLLSIKKSAEYMGRGVYGVREMIWNGEVPIVRSGRKIFIDIQDLDSYIQKNKITYSIRPEDERPGNGKSK